MSVVTLTSRRFEIRHTRRKNGRTACRKSFRCSLALRLHMLRLLGPLSLDQVIYLTERARIRDYRPAEVILEGAAASRYHLLVLQGDVEVQRRFAGRNGAYSHYCALQPTEEMGGFAFLKTVTGDVRATAGSAARCLLIDADLADELLGWCEHFAPLKQTHPGLWRRASRMRDVSMIFQLPPGNLETAVRSMAVLEVVAGGTVVTAGAAEGYYSIEEGEADVWRTDPLTGEPRLVAQLGPGDAIGGASLEDSGSRNVSVRMLRRGRLRYLSKVDFDALAAGGAREEVSAEKAYAMMVNGKARMLDCRTGVEMQDARIPGSICIPLDRLRWELRELDPTIRYVVYCRSGRLSRVAAAIMQQRGISATTLAGGVNAWPYALEWAVAA